MSKGGLSTADLQRAAKRLNHASVASESKFSKDDVDQEAISSLGKQAGDFIDRRMDGLTVDLSHSEQLYIRHGGDLDEM